MLITKLIDTDVLIWHLRGYQQATQKLAQPFAISAITYLELLQGARNKAEILAIQKSLQLHNATQLNITDAITQRAKSLMEALTLSHGLQLGDALIAATALEQQLTVLTGNTKHFSAITDLKIERFDLQHRL